MYSEFETLNKYLALIDACQTDATIDLNINLTTKSAGINKALSIQQYADKDFILHLTMQNKKQLIKVLADTFNDSDFCHYRFHKDGVLIGYGFDGCEINFLNPTYFILTQEHLYYLDDAEIRYPEIV